LLEVRVAVVWCGMRSYVGGRVEYRIEKKLVDDRCRITSFGVRQRYWMTEV